MIDEIEPKSSFMIINFSGESDFNSKAFDLLYQPIIGLDAYGLYKLFLNLKDNELHNHYEIMNILQLDKKAFIKARYRLEGSGLLKVYSKSVSNQIILNYELVNPLQPKQFFNEDLLSILFLEMVGESRFLELSNRFKSNDEIINNSEEITKNFFDVFNVNYNNLSDKPRVIENYQKENTVKSSIEKDFYVDDFDFKLLLEILGKSFVDIEQVKKEKDMITSEHQVYGINELDMSRYIEKATNFTNNLFDVKKLQLLISRDYQMFNSNNNNNELTNESNKEEINQNQFSKKQQQVIKIANDLAPIQFLNSLKHQKGGFTTSGEERIIKDLIRNNILNKSVVNILIYHILIDQSLPTLNKNLVDTIANDWKQKNIQTVEQAMFEIKNRNTTPKVTKKYNKKNYKQNNVIETLPDWANSDEYKKTKKNDVDVDELNKKLNAQLNKRKDKKEDD
ncbi:hypothetical protein GSH19_03090 [Lactobacillus sp. S2-2]|uniref:DnaD domain protein n=1 Tax=Lactobacillus sp. S2-2 TaxID=2692917 RepID=UPI001F1DE4A7|nr:DnaD domain protein [Lactobacillus sp. S2-2]MCF6515150.1 hypothetical protein [Lactobacillus sp. S2-2]